VKQDGDQGKRRGEKRYVRHEKTLQLQKKQSKNPPIVGKASSWGIAKHVIVTNK
jgi:hypothetical protein